MKICLFIFAFLFAACPVLAAETFSPYDGAWQCEVQGEKGEGLLIMDMKNRVIQMQPPKPHAEFSLPFTVSKNNGSQLELKIKTKDNGEHFMELNMLEPNKMRISFLNEKDAPLLECARKTENAAGF